MQEVPASGPFDNRQSCNKFIHKQQTIDGYRDHLSSKAKLISIERQLRP
jgi:hypothetical protein